MTRSGVAFFWFIVADAHAKESIADQAFVAWQPHVAEAVRIFLSGQNFFCDRDSPGGRLGCCEDDGGGPAARPSHDRGGAGRRLLARVPALAAGCRKYKAARGPALAPSAARVALVDLWLHPRRSLPVVTHSVEDPEAEGFLLGGANAPEVSVNDFLDVARQSLAKKQAMRKRKMREKEAAAAKANKESTQATGMGESVEADDETESELSPEVLKRVQELENMTEEELQMEFQRSAEFGQWLEELDNITEEEAEKNAQDIIAAGQVEARKNWNRFDIVEFEGMKARTMFPKMVSSFSEPLVLKLREMFFPSHRTVREAWYEFQRTMNGTARDTTMYSAVAAMCATDKTVPCAAAFYSNQDQNPRETFILTALIRNNGDECRSAGAAILCHLIRNSRDRSGTFRPLNLVPLPEDQNSRRYFEEFGCVGGEVLECREANPSKCELHANKSFQAHAYFGFAEEANPSDGTEAETNKILAATSTITLSPLAAVLLSVLVGGSGVLFAMLCVRCRSSEQLAEPFLTAETSNLGHGLCNCRDTFA